MYNSHYLMPKKISGGHPLRRKTAVMLACLLLTVFFAAGATLAFLTTRTDSVVNTFTPADVSCSVLEGEDGETFDGMTKQDVRIANTGNTDAYIRAAVVVSWVADSGNAVYAVLPQENTDYTITFDPTSGWIAGADGFWYHTAPVAPQGETSVLIEHCSPIDGKAPEGFHLSVEIVASAIQSTPVSVVAELWGVTLKNGTIVSVPAGN